MLKKTITLIILVFVCCFIINAQEPQVRELYDQAVTESKKGNLDSAIQFYTEAIKLDNGYTYAYTGRGLAFMRKGSANRAVRQQNYDFAIRDLSMAIDLNPKSAGAYINRSSVYSLTNEFDKALADLQRAEEVDSKFPYIYSARGNIYTKMKQFQLAVDSYSKALEIKSHSDFYRGRCNAYYEFEKFENAIADCSEAINLNPKGAWAFFYRGLARQKLEQNALAISDFRKTLELDPNHMGAKQQLETLLKNNKY